MMKASAHSIPPGILQKIRAVRRRRWLMEIGSVFLFAIALTLGLVGVAAAVDWCFAWSHPVARWLPLVALLAIFGAAVRALLTRMRWHRSLAEEALEIDRALPGLEERWSTVSELAASPLPPTLLGSPDLIARVGTEAESFVPRVRASSVLPGAKMERPFVALIAGSALFAAVALVLSGHFTTLLQRLAQPWRAITLTRIEMPAAARRVLRDEPMEISAQFSGRQPASATLILRDARGGERSIPFAPGSTGIKHRVAQITESFAFQIRAGDAATPWIPVNMVDRPAITKLAMRIVSPAYTKRAPVSWKVLPQTARAVRGSALEIEFTADQPLAVATVQISQIPSPVQRPLEPAGERAYRFASPLEDTLDFSLLLENDIGLRALAAQCRVEVDDDQPPAVELQESTDAVVLTATDQLKVEFLATDDFGVAQAELVATMEKPGEATREVTLPIDLGAQAGEPQVKGSLEIDLTGFKIDAQTKFSYAVRVRDNRGAASQKGARERAGEKTTAESNGPAGDSPEAKASAATAAADQPKAPGDSRDEKTGAETAAAAGKKEDGPAMAQSRKGRVLDVPGQSCTPPKAVRIEQFARGEARDRDGMEKKSLAIDPVLQALREAATAALARTEDAMRDLSVVARLDSIREAHVQTGLGKIGEAIAAVAALKKESAETPFAFFAIQADALVSGGLEPGAQHLQAALKAQPALPELKVAATHLRWMLETLETLTRQFTSLKDVKKTEEMMRQIKEMHLAFVEDLPEWMKAGAKAAYQRSLVEVDAAYAKAYEEMLRKRRDVMMRLAELLATQPELAARFLDQTSATANNYRDELLRLRLEQEELVKLASATETSAGDAKAVAALWFTRLRLAQEKAAAAANRAANEAKIWIPNHLPETQKKEIHAAALAASSAARSAASSMPLAGVSVGSFQSATAAMERYETVLAALGRDSEFAENRREDLEKLRRATAQNRDFARLAREGRFPDALRAAQALLNAETGTIAGLLLQDTVTLAQVSPEAAAAAKLLKTVLVEKVATPQRSAEAALKAKTWSAARDFQYTSAHGLNEAVEVLDDFMKKAIKKLDEQKASPAPPMAPTFEELLKSLEREKRLTFSLGMSCCRKPNIQIETNVERKSPPDAQEAAQTRNAPAPKPETAAEKNGRERNMSAAREAAQEAARQAAVAQQAANERAKKMSEQYRAQTVDLSAPGVARNAQDQKADWNTLASELRGNLAQERGRTPPKKYEGAIEEYFKMIATEAPAKAAP